MKTDVTYVKELYILVGIWLYPYSTDSGRNRSSIVVLTSNFCVSIRGILIIKNTKLVLTEY